MNILKIEELRGMKEDALRQQVIMPLMERMGYRDVFEWHGGAGELGKDIVAWQEVGFGNRQNTAVVAKGVNITGKVATVHEVMAQVHQAFNGSFNDPSTGEKQRVHHVWVVTNKKFGKEAREAIGVGLQPERRGYVTFLDGNQLWAEWKKHFPVEVYEVLEEAQRRVEDIGGSEYGAQVVLGTDGQPFASIDAGGRKVILVERYPGQLEQEPVELGGRFEFPDTPEARAVAEEVRAAWTTGSKVRIPGEYVQRFDFPDAINRMSEQLLGVKPERITSLEISTADNPTVIPVRLDIETADGECATLEYIELRVLQAGTDEMTLTNDEQSYPIRVKVVINFANGSGRLSLARKDERIAAPVLLQFLTAVRCFAKPCHVQATVVGTDERLFRSTKTEHTDAGVDDRWLELVADLAVVQGKIGRPIFIPDRNFSHEEIQTVALLRTLISEPVIEQTWNRIDLTWSSEDAESALQQFAQTEAYKFEGVERTLVELFGATLPLGPVRFMVEAMRLDNEAEVREQIAAASDKDTEIRFRFVPSGSNKMVRHYLDWGGNSETPADEGSQQNQSR